MPPSPGLEQGFLDQVFRCVNLAYVLTRPDHKLRLQLFEALLELLCMHDVLLPSGNIAQN